MSKNKQVLEKTTLKTPVEYTIEKIQLGAGNGEIKTVFLIKNKEMEKSNEIILMFLIVLF